MSERIYTVVDGSLVARDGGRDPARLYADIGRDPDGAVRLREFTDAEMLAREFPVAPAAVSKRTIRDRLYSAGLLKAAYDALYAATDDDAVMRAQLWDDAETISTTDQRARAFLTSIGANPDEVLAP